MQNTDCYHNVWHSFLHLWAKQYTLHPNLQRAAHCAQNLYNLCDFIGGWYDDFEAVVTRNTKITHNKVQIAMAMIVVPYRLNNQ